MKNTPILLLLVSLLFVSCAQTAVFNPASGKPIMATGADMKNVHMEVRADGSVIFTADVVDHSTPSTAFTNEIDAVGNSFSKFAAAGALSTGAATWIARH